MRGTSRSRSWSSWCFSSFLLPLLFPHKHLLLCWNSRVKDLSTLCVFLPLHFVASVCSLHKDSWKWKFVSLLLLGHWTLDGDCDLLWSRPFVASWDLLWSLGSSQSFCGLCLKIVVRDSISAQKEINSGRWTELLGKVHGRIGWGHLWRLEFETHWYVSNVSIIFDVPCCYYVDCHMFWLHFILFLCIFWD